MAYNVKFLRGTAEDYKNLIPKDSNTFYYTGSDLYLGEIKLSNAADLEAAISRIATNENSITTIKGQLEELIGDTGILAQAKTYTDNEVKKVTDSIGTVPTDSTVMAEIADAKKAGTDAQSTIDTYKTANDTRVKGVEDRATALENAVGNTEHLTTTSQVVVDAINELKSDIGNAESAGKVTIDTSTTTEGYLKSYAIKQGKTAVGTIDIPKDLVVTSGEVVVDPDGQPAGTYIKLTIANQAAPIYINVKTLVDVYTAQASAAQIQLAISPTNEISAIIVAGAVDTAKLADDAVTTAKVADKNITLVKLSDSVQESLGLADTALQSADITTGSANGTIAVEGTDVVVKGLGSAAYTESTAYETAGAATIAENNAKKYTDEALTWGSF